MPKELANEALARPLLRTALIEKRILIIGVADTAARDAGVVPGVEIVEVDGVPVMEYVQRHVVPFQAASTPQDLEARAYGWAMLEGAISKPVELTLRDAAGSTMRRTVARRPIARILGRVPLRADGLSNAARQHRLRRAHDVQRGPHRRHVRGGICGDCQGRRHRHRRPRERRREQQRRLPRARVPDRHDVCRIAMADARISTDLPRVGPARGTLRGHTGFGRAEREAPLHETGRRARRCPHVFGGRGLPRRVSWNEARTHCRGANGRQHGSAVDVSPARWWRRKDLHEGRLGAGRHGVRRRRCPAGSRGSMDGGGCSLRARSSARRGRWNGRKEGPRMTRIRRMKTDLRSCPDPSSSVGSVRSVALLLFVSSQCSLTIEQHSSRVVRARNESPGLQRLPFFREPSGAGDPGRREWSPRTTDRSGSSRAPSPRSRGRCTAGRTHGGSKPSTAGARRATGEESRSTSGRARHDDWGS